MEELKKSSTSKNKEKTEWVRETNNDGIREGVKVKKVSNGYIVEVYKCGHENNDYDNAYTDDRKEYISTKNPLEGDIQAEEVNLSSQILDTIKGLNF